MREGRCGKAESGRFSARLDEQAEKKPPPIAGTGGGGDLIGKSGGLLGGFGFLGIGGAPTGGGHQFATESGAGATRLTCFAGVKGATIAALLGLVHRILGGIHLGGVFLVTESHGDRIVFLEFHWRSLSKCLSTKKGGCPGGEGELEEEMAA